MQFKFSKSEKEIIELVSKTAQAQEKPAFLIGGYVRDKILKRPSRDIDIVTLGSGIELAEAVVKEISPTPKINIFKTFGTAMIKMDDWEIEFVGARKESYAENSRKPFVEAGTLVDDQNRRDFTINAMALSLNKDDFGNLIDPFGGLGDIQHKIIRTPLDPDITFSDDPLRMMRAIRFATQLNFKIEEKTYAALSRNKERIKIISQERITDELNKIILAEKPSIGFKILFESGLLEIIFPEMVELYGVEMIEGQGHKDNFYHTLKVLDNLCATSDDLWLRWSAILHDIGKPSTKRYHKDTGWTFHGHDAIGARMVPEIFKKLRLPLDSKMKLVQKMVLLHLRPIALTKEEVSDSAMRRLLFEAGEDIDDLMKLCEADITSKNKIKVKRYLENFELVREKLKDVEERDKLRNWQPPISGEEIIETFHLKPSKTVGVIKNKIKDAILDGKIRNNHEEAYKFMLDIGKELGLNVQKK